MYRCCFKSSNGYNSTIREGKIYIFTSNETLRYLLQVNPDLIQLNSPIKRLINYYKKSYRPYIRFKMFLRRKKISMIKFIFLREYDLIRLPQYIFE